MGMYTEIVVRFNFIPSEIEDNEYKILDFMFNPNSDLDESDFGSLPSHDFFKCSRWASIGSCSSFYHHPNAVKDWYKPEYEIKNPNSSRYVFNRSDLKNYDNEIGLFFDWLDSLGLFYEGEFMGYSLYEEDNTPTIYNSKARLEMRCDNDKLLGEYIDLKD